MAELIQSEDRRTAPRVHLFQALHCDRAFQIWNPRCRCRCSITVRSGCTLSTSLRCRIPHREQKGCGPCNSKTTNMLPQHSNICYSCLARVRVASVYAVLCHGRIRLVSRRNAPAVGIVSNDFMPGIVKSSARSHLQVGAPIDRSSLPQALFGLASGNGI